MLQFDNTNHYQKMNFIALPANLLGRFSFNEVHMKRCKKDTDNETRYNAQHQRTRHL